MKILHVIGSLAPRYGGPSKVVLEMCQALVGRGHDVEILTTDIDGPGRLQVPIGSPVRDGAVAITYHAGSRPRRYGTSVGLARGLSQRVAEFDVVHVHSLYRFHTLVAGAVCRKRSVPYVLRPHGTLDPYHRAVRRRSKWVYDVLWERRNVRLAAALHCTSRFEQQMVEQSGFHTRTFVVPNGVDVARFERHGEDSAFVVRYPELAERRLVTFLGRLTPKKGADVLLQAFPTVAASLPGTHLVIAGPDENGIQAGLRRRVNSLRLESSVSLLGMLNDELKVGLLRRSAAFVLPSVDENFGVAVVEAMAAGAPVVITTGVGIYPEVEAAEAGLVVPRDSDALATAVIRLLSNPDLAARTSVNGRELAQKKFCWQQIARQLEEMYRDIAVSNLRRELNE
jgi:glycosyltransferase involved in cell wall biosynthesis